MPREQSSSCGSHIDQACSGTSPEVFNSSPCQQLHFYVQVEFEKPNMTMDALLGYGRLLVREQENVRRVQLAEAYMSGAELAGTDGKSIPDELMEEIYERKAEEEKKQSKASGSLLG